MQTRGKITAITLASALVLGGGAAAAIGIGGLTPAEPVAASDPTPSASAAVVEGETVEESAVVDEAEGASVVDAATEDVRDYYLRGVRVQFTEEEGAQWSDDDLFGFAEKVCSELAAGSLMAEIDLVGGPMDATGPNAKIRASAMGVFCPLPA